MPRWQCPDGTLVPARHKIQASRKGTGSAGRVTPGTGEFCYPLFQRECTARSHRATSPHPPTGYSDGRHPTPVSRRRRRTPEADCSSIGLRGAYAGAGPSGGEREWGDVPGCWCGERPGLASSWGKVLVGLLQATSAVKMAGRALSLAMAFYNRLIQGHFSCDKIWPLKQAFSLTITWSFHLVFFIL